MLKIVLFIYGKDEFIGELIKISKRCRNKRDDCFKLFIFFVIMGVQINIFYL